MTNQNTKFHKELSLEQIEKATKFLDSIAYCMSDEEVERAKAEAESSEEDLRWEALAICDMSLSEALEIGAYVHFESEECEPDYYTAHDLNKIVIEQAMNF